MILELDPLGIPEAFALAVFCVVVSGLAGWFAASVVDRLKDLR